MTARKKTAATEGIAPGETPSPSPRLLEPREKFTPFDLTEFWRGKSLWAVNYFVLWPLGLALVANVEPKEGPVESVTSLDVRQWVYPDGELGETIDQAKDDNQADYDVFLGFVRERLLAMKPEERALALARFGQHEMVSAAQVVTARP